MPFTYLDAIEDTSEDPKFYARDVPEDDRDERGKDEWEEATYEP